ncbi:hypothetical protein BDR04DRAFT_260132 [Suillus decipiens]|nr:hypothetical protein BDR04DRAFT_260132 [Suillus decipiens]
MVNEAKQNLDDTLTNAPTGTIEGERLPDEHVTLMRSTCSIAEEQFPIAEKCEIQVKAAQSSSSLQLPADISSQSHTSDLTPKLEHDAWPSQKPSEVKSRFACSATDALDRRSLLHIASLSNRPVLPESWFPSTPEENALNFTISQQGSTTSTTSDRVPDIPSSTEPHNITDSAKGRERDRILTLEQQWSAIYRARDRRRTTSYTYIEAKASAPAFERLDEDYPSMQPHLSLSVAPNLRSVIPTTRYSRSSSSLNSAVPIGYSYSSDSLSSTVPMGYSHFPSSSQLPPPSASRPIASKKLFSLDDDDFRSSPSPKDWDIPLRLRHETEFVHSPQTPDEHPQSWQSPNFRTRHSSQDTCYRYYHAQHVHPYEDDLDGSDLWVYDERRLRQREESFQKREEEISMREQELKRREEDIIREEAAKEKGDKFMRGEKEVKRMEDEVVCKELEIARQEEGEIIEYQEDKIKWKEKLVKEKEEKAGRPEAQDWKRAEDLRRREEPVARRLEEEERRMTRNVLQKSEESKCQEDEVKSKERASGTKEAEIQRKEEELVRREEELFQREAEMNRRHDQQKVQQEEFRKHVEEIKRQSVEEKTRQGRKSWGYHPRRTTPPPRMSTSRSFSSSVGPWSISDRDKRMPAASPPANRDRGRSTSISTSRSSTTWTSSTRLSSTNSWRSNMSKPQTPLAQSDCR